MAKIRCLTWNVRELNDHKKDRLVNSYLRRLRIDMFLAGDPPAQPNSLQIIPPFMG